jgi:hypothetical protein
MGAVLIPLPIISRAAGRKADAARVNGLRTGRGLHSIAYSGSKSYPRRVIRLQSRRGHSEQEGASDEPGQHTT